MSPPIQEKLLERVQQQIDASADPAYLGKIAGQLVAGGMQSVDTMGKAFFDLMGGALSTTKPDSGDKNRSDS